jgi:multiple sugar transport system substrate-binding protein
MGTAADAAARQKVIDAFAKVHPEIKVKVQAIQAVDWKDFFTKILTMVAAGTPPDVVYVATEGLSCSPKSWPTRWTSTSAATPRT